MVPVTFGFIGSVARGKARLESDLDILVEIKPGRSSVRITKLGEGSLQPPDLLSHRSSSRIAISSPESQEDYEEGES